MAKKKSSTFNMAAEIRDIVRENPELSGPEVVKQLKAKFPRKRINETSAKVAFSKARSALGIGGKRKKTVRKRRPTSRHNGAVNVNMPALQAAKKYIAEVGDVEAARTALDQVVKLQVN